MIFGVVCILYYLLICLHMHRWDSRFPRFWLGLGAAVILFESRRCLLPKPIVGGIRTAEAVVLVLFLVAELLILSGMCRNDDEKECEYVIVLGAKVNGTRLSAALKRRLDRAVIYLKKHGSSKVVVSGGRGYGELVTEAHAMGEYLQDCGISAERILSEPESTTTRENLIFSGRMILEDMGAGRHEDQPEREIFRERLGQITVGIVTNNYHIYRARHIAEQVGYRKTAVMPVATNRLMLPNYMVREFFGVLKMWIHRKKR